ncbi:MAG: VTT domain-containing protein, partial [Candidatus Aenigmatarchaeota archaeon]
MLVEYLGIFISSLLGSATVIFPLPSFLIVFGAGAALNPFLVGVVAGVGSAIGELIGYCVGYGGKKLLEKRVKMKKIKWFSRAEKWMKKSGFIVILIFAMTPLPDDIIGIIAGSIKYDVKKYFIACLIGKIILSLFIAYAGYYGAQWALDYV